MSRRLNGGRIAALLAGLALAVAGGYGGFRELQFAAVSTLRMELYIGVIAVGLLLAFPKQMAAALSAAGRALAGLLPSLLTKPAPPPSDGDHHA